MSCRKHCSAQFSLVAPLTHSYLGVKTEDANPAAVYKLSHRICAGAVEILLKLS